MMRRAAFGVLLGMAAILAAMLPAAAHRAPNSIVSLEFAEQVVRAEIRVPITELGHATQESDFGRYLRDHVAVETADGRSWTLLVRGVRNADYEDHPYLVADLELTPPAGASVRQFVLVDDAVTHEVRNHVIWVVSGAGADAQILGALQYPQKRLTVDRD